MKLNSIQEKELAEVLLSLGLKEKEQVVYRALLEVGESTLTPLARHTALPVSTTESILDRLASDGLAVVSKIKSRRVYTAAEPVALKQMLESKMREVTSILPFLETLKTESSSTTKTRVYHRERMADIFDAAMRAKSKHIYEIVAARDFQEILGEKYHFTRRRIENNVQLKSLRVESRELKTYSRETNRRELREAKFLPRELTFKGTILFWDSTVAFFTTKAEGLAITIESTVLAEMMKQFFELFWEISRAMETK